MNQRDRGGGGRVYEFYESFLLYFQSQFYLERINISRRVNDLQKDCLTNDSNVFAQMQLHIKRFLQRKFKNSSLGIDYGIKRTNWGRDLQNVGREGTFQVVSGDNHSALPQACQPHKGLLVYIQDYPANALSLNRISSTPPSISSPSSLSCFLSSDFYLTPWVGGIFTNCCFPSISASNNNFVELFFLQRLILETKCH